MGAARKATINGARLFSHAAQTVAEARMHKAAIEAELYRNRYKHWSKNDDDLPIVHSAGNERGHAMTITFHHYAERQNRRRPTWPVALVGLRSRATLEIVATAKKVFPVIAVLRGLGGRPCRDDRAPAGDLAPAPFPPLSESSASNRSS